MGVQVIWKGNCLCLSVSCVTGTLLIFPSLKMVSSFGDILAYANPQHYCTAFIGFVVEPLFALWSKYFSSNTTKTIHENLASNKLCWADLSPKKATVTESSDDSN